MGRQIAYVGTYPDSPNKGGGGIVCLEVRDKGRRLSVISETSDPRFAGYLAYSSRHGTLYAVDERKTDGRGPVQPPASVHAFRVDPTSGNLAKLNDLAAPGPFPTFIALNPDRNLLVTANHGAFDHIERVVLGPNGWQTEYVYDDSVVILFDLNSDGRLDKIRDLHVLEGHGKDPNFSPQAGGHAQSGPHAHCAVIDPSGNYVLVCDKGTDKVLTFRLGDRLELVQTYQFPEETGPRHLEFEPSTGRVLLTLEFASELACMAFDATTGSLELLDRRSTLGAGYKGPNEPAEVRVHPAGRFVYVNNRGEDSLAWFEITAQGGLVRHGHLPLAKSIHPGLAARSFMIDPSGSFMLLGDRPANLVRAYRLGAKDGKPAEIAKLPVTNPAYIQLINLD